jgi:hypothetical protein
VSHYRVGRLFVRSNVPALRREARLRRALEGCLVTLVLIVLGTAYQRRCSYGSWSVWRDASSTIVRLVPGGGPTLVSRLGRYGRWLAHAWHLRVPRGQDARRHRENGGR